MGIFRRSKHREPADPRAAIAEFWRWWGEAGGEQAARSIATGANQEIVAAMSAHVSAVDEGLAWEFSPGVAARHCLVVSPEGDARLRATARRWLNAAPPADDTWEYADSRQAIADLSSVQLAVADQTVSFGDIVVAARREGSRLDVTVHHPVFADTDERTRVTISFLALDNALGETDVEVWIGEVHASEVSPLDGFGLEGLRAVVRDLKDESQDDDGEPNWAMFSAEGREGPILAMAQIPLAAAFAPELDTHVAAFVPYVDQTERGLPGEASLTALRDLEDSVTAALGSAGRVVAHQSHAGVRILHAYVDSSTTASEQLRQAVETWSQGTVDISVTPDPGWENVAHLRT
jgi:hypothetical protein